jgi:hypothetical protein
MTAPLDIARLLETGGKLLAGGRVALAIQAIERALDLAPDDPRVLLALASAHLANRDREKAAAILLGLAARMEDSPLAAMELCHPLGAAGEPLAALRLLRRVRDSVAPDLFGMLVRKKISEVMILAERLRFAGHPDAALEAYEYALSGVPDSFKVRHDLLLHQIKMGRLEAALETLRRAPAFDDPEMEATFRRYRHLCEWMAEAMAAVPERAGRVRAEASGKPRLVYILPIWGADYVDLCTRHIRSLAAPGNVPALVERFDLRLALVTTAPDHERLVATGVLDLFGDRFPAEVFIMPAELVRNDEHLKPSPVMYSIFSMALHLGIHFAKAIGAAITPMVVDAVFADGALGRLGQLAEQGHEAICLTCPVCDRETFIPAIDARFGAGGGPIGIKARDLTNLAAEHLHLIVRSALVSPANRDFSCPPGVLFWRSGTDMVAHGFHVHPLYISAGRVAAYDSYRFMSVDGHLCADIFPEPADWERIHVIADADEFAYVTLTSNRQEGGTTGRPFSLEQARLYKTDRSMVSAYNEWLFRHPMRFHGIFPPGTPDEYDPALVEEILDWNRP